MCIRSCHLSDHIILHHLITDADHILLILSLIGVGGEDQMQARFEDQIKKIIKRSNAGEGKVLNASEATTLTDPGQMRPLKKHQLKVASSNLSSTSLFVKLITILIICIMTIDLQVKYTERPNSQNNVGKSKYMEKISVYFRPIWHFEGKQTWYCRRK